MTEMQQEDQRVVILLVDLVPDQRRELPRQFRERGAFSVARPGLEDGQAVIKRLF